jgi:hypothetical protein
MLANPFITTGYLGKDYFCDREEETRLLMENIVIEGYQRISGKKC